MVSMQAWLPEYDYSTRNASLAPLYSDFQRQKEFYVSRRKETQEVIDMLNDRIEAELTYAMRLDKISNYAKSFKIGNLADEVENYKMSCAARARQAAEVSENVHQDCISPLKVLIEAQDVEFNKVIEMSNTRQDKLHQIDAGIKRTAMAYFKAAREAEDSVVKYQKIKYEAELTYIARQQVYDNMMNNLMELKDCEVEYKETVDQANNFVQKFRRMILKYCRACRDYEIERCTQIHSSINQFVVFEMSAEMNNKYDTANFAKVLEEFSPQQEMRTIDQYLYGVVQAQRDEDYEDNNDGDRSTTDKNGGAGRRTFNSSNIFDSQSDDFSSESAPLQTKDGDEPQEDLRPHDQLCDEITVLPNGFIPIVLNPKFEFVPFESRLEEDENPMVARIDINQLTQVQLREPPARVSDFYRANSSTLQHQLNGNLNEQDKKELIFFLLQKIFCVGQQVYQMHAMHSEYTVLVKLITAADPIDRNMFVYELKSLFQGRQNVTQIVFKNLINTVSAIYDSYLPPDNEIEGAEMAATMTFDLTDLDTVRNFTQQYFMQVPTKPSQAQQITNQQLVMTPCLEAQLTQHRIWSFPEVWLGISKDLEITTILGIHFFQDQMASYEVNPMLLEQVSLRLVQEIRNKQILENGANNASNIDMDLSLATQTTSMSSEAEQGCHARITQYRNIYTDRQDEKQRMEQELLFQRKLQQSKSVNLAQQAKRHSLKYPNQGIGQQLSNMMGGLFSSGGGIRIDSTKPIKKEGSPRMHHQRHNQSSLAESSSRPSLAALLNKPSRSQVLNQQPGSVSASFVNSSALARRKSPNERTQSPQLDSSQLRHTNLSQLNFKSDDSNYSIGNGDIIRQQARPVNKIIVKKAHYMSRADSNLIMGSSSRSPQRSPQIKPMMNQNANVSESCQQQKSARIVNIIPYVSSNNGGSEEQKRESTQQPQKQ